MGLGVIDLASEAAGGARSQGSIRGEAVRCDPGPPRLPRFSVRCALRCDPGRAHVGLGRGAGDRDYFYLIALSHRPTIAAVRATQTVIREK